MDYQEIINSVRSKIKQGVSTEEIKDFLRRESANVDLTVKKIKIKRGGFADETEKITKTLRQIGLNEDDIDQFLARIQSGVGSDDHHPPDYLMEVKGTRRLSRVFLFLCFGALLLALVFYFLLFGVDKETIWNIPNPLSLKKSQPSENNKFQPAISIFSASSTKFSDYEPYLASAVKPQSRSYDLPMDMLKVENIRQFSLAKKTEQFLERQGFAAAISDYSQPYSLYQNNTKKGVPNFVTIDSVLHAYHILYDYTLRSLEAKKLIPDLRRFNDFLSQAVKNQYENLQEPELKVAVLKNWAYLAVASNLLDPKKGVDFLPVEIQDAVKKEIALIIKHSGFASSPIWNYQSKCSVDCFKEDYSQYVPRGHYTRSDDFMMYFKAMTWHGRMPFRIEPPGSIPGTIDQAKGREETRRALLLVLLISQNKADQEELLAIWGRIYQPTVFFVGRADDLNVYDYLGAAREVFGDNIQMAELAKDQKIDEFIARIKKMEGPKIYSSFVLDTEDASRTTKGFRLMGQRFIPDSYIFQQLVFDKIKNYTGQSPWPFTAVETVRGLVRGFPRGLDVAAVLGSQRAREIIDQEGDSSYIKYDEQFNKLRGEFLALPQEQWSENLYWNWLYSLLPTLAVKPDGYPAFMRQPAWLDKDLNSFLGSWAELRHDTILYAKQSYTIMTTAMPQAEEPKFAEHGFVEPNPEVYARLASLSKMMRIGLEKRGLLDKEYQQKLSSLEQTLLTFKEISEKELSGQDLDQADRFFIKGIGDTLEALTTFSSVQANKISSEVDKNMAIVADVHTDGNSKQVLEEGVGNPLNLFVVINEGDKLFLTSGPLFSYYEFKQPMANRLTDEKWQTMEKPSLPLFTQSFVTR